jgi:hypothetical protein
MRCSKVFCPIRPKTPKENRLKMLIEAILDLALITGSLAAVGLLASMALRPLSSEHAR